MELAEKVLLDYGLSILIVAFCGWMVYRYLDIKLDMMRKEVDRKLLAKTYIIKGTVTKKDLKASDRYELDLTIIEDRLRISQN